MSSDLWAAFGEGEAAANPWATGNPGQNTTSGVHTKSTTASQQATVDADPWADFETAKPQPAPVEDEWSTFESADAAPANTFNDDWSALENPTTLPRSEGTTTLTTIADPWAAFENPPKASGLGNANASQGAQDDWSAFEAPAALPETKATSTLAADSDPWSAFNKPVTIVAKKAEETIFNDDGLMWDADAAMQNETTDSTASHPIGGSLIDFSGLTVSDQHEASDDDEFGDFAEAETPPVPQVKPRTPSKRDVSTSILQNRVETQGATAANKLIFGATKKGVGSRQDQSTEQQRSVAKPKPASRPAAKKPATAPVPTAVDNDDIEEAWDDFESLPPEPTKPSLSSSTKSTSSATPQTSKPSSSIASAPTAAPPTNIPPPSVLISLLHTTILPSMLTSSPCSTASTASSTLSSSSNPSSSSPSPNPTLRTTARILAGRKSRWKRDTHLAQSMSISSLSSGPGVRPGMKLTGIDKAESVREDREAAEVVRVFRAMAGQLRARALRAGEKGIVEVGGNLGIRVERGNGGGERGSGAMKPCVVCGLRRAERVGSVDGDVYDGFGEWWVEFWGHRECRDWWVENEGKLGKR